MAWALSSNQIITVRENSEKVRTNIQVRAGDTLIFTAWGAIWSGVWFTGLNGPRGWNWRSYDNKFPLPGAHPYCLLGQVGGNQWWEIGAGLRMDENPFQGELFLEVNDDVHGNGDGAFQCQVQVYRNA